MNKSSHYKKIAEALSQDKLKLSKEEKRAFLESVRKFEGYGAHIYRASKLNEIVNEIGQLVEVAQNVTLQETDGWFDNVTVSRHNKRLAEAYKVFEKSAKDVGVLQQRMEAAYEDIAEVLKKYYDV